MNLVAPIFWVGSHAGRIGGRIKREDANKGGFKDAGQSDGALETLPVSVKWAVNGNLTQRRSNRGNAYPLSIQLLFDMGYLLIGEIKHIRVFDAAQVQERDTFTFEDGKLLIQVWRDLVGKGGETNHG